MGKWATPTLPGLLQHQSSAGHPRPASMALCASGGGVAGSGVSLLSAPCGPSARCGQDARAPRASLPGPRLGQGCGWLGGVAPVGALRAFGPVRARCPRSQDIAHRAVPRAGGGWLGGVAPVGALRAFGPVRARCPRSQDIAPGAVPRVGGWNAPDPFRADRQCNQNHIELTCSSPCPASALPGAGSPAVPNPARM